MDICYSKNKFKNRDTYYYTILIEKSEGKYQEMITKTVKQKKIQPNKHLVYGE